MRSMGTTTPLFVALAFSNPWAWRDFLSWQMGQDSSSLCISYPSTLTENPLDDADLVRAASSLNQMSLQYLLDGTSQNEISMTCLTSLRV